MKVFALNVCALEVCALNVCALTVNELSIFCFATLLSRNLATSLFLCFVMSRWSVVNVRIARGKRIKGKCWVIAEEMPTTECGWECRGLQWMKMLTYGLSLRPVVFIGV